MKRATPPSRRVVLQGGAAGFALAVMPFPLWAQTPPPPLEEYATEYFTPAEWAFVMAATARLIPTEGDGPGALEARVPVFIDSQLAGRFGQAADWYMEAPHEPGANPDFGYQTPLTPAELYRESIPLFDAWCEDRHGARFADLPPDHQDAALEALEEDAARAAESLGPAAGEGEEATDMGVGGRQAGDEDGGPANGQADGYAGGEQVWAQGPEASTTASPEPRSPRILPDEMREFFALLLQNTKEGYFADPRYGGNFGMAGWIHIGFPGARASFLEWVERDNVPYRLGPVSIAGERA